MARRGGVEDGRRMITACCVCALQRCPGRLYTGVRFLFQAVRPIGKTRNQLSDQRATHVILSDLNPAILLYPPGNGWVGGVETLCHMSLLHRLPPSDRLRTYLSFVFSRCSKTHRQASFVAPSSWK